MFISPEIVAQILVSAVLVGFIYALVSVGLSLIFGLMDIVNFAHGEFLMLSMYVAFWLFTLYAIDPLVTLPFGFALFFAAGVAVYYVIIKRIMKGPMLAQMMSTFGLAIVLRGGAQYLWSPDFRTVNEPLVKGSIGLFGLYVGLPQVVAGVGAIIAFAALWLFVQRSELGLALQATAQDKQAASLMGINSERMYALGWGIGLGCVGVAGVLLVNYFYIFPDVGFLFGLIAYVSVALGGFGSITGALVAGLIISLVEHTAGWVVPAFKYAVVYLVYIAVVVVRPRGLFGRF